MFLVTRNTQHISLHRSLNVLASGLQVWAIIEQFTDFNKHCWPNIRLRGLPESQPLYPCIIICVCFSSLTVENVALVVTDGKATLDKDMLPGVIGVVHPKVK